MGYESLIYLGCISLLTSLIILFFFVLFRILWLIKVIIRKPVDSPHWISSFAKLLAIVIWNIVGAAVLFFGIYLTEYDAVDENTYIIEMGITPLNGSSSAKIEFAQSLSTGEKIRTEYNMSGHRWKLIGKITKVNDRFGLFTVNPRYKLLELRIDTGTEISGFGNKSKRVNLDRKNESFAMVIDFLDSLPIYDSKTVSVTFGSGIEKTRLFVFANDKQFSVKENNNPFSIAR